MFDFVSEAPRWMLRRNQNRHVSDINETLAVWKRVLIQSLCTMISLISTVPDGLLQGRKFWMQLPSLLELRV
jgi:hypothetical protein